MSGGKVRKMAHFSNDSSTKLGTCHILIQDLMNEVIKDIDFKVIYGYRGEEEQNRLYAEGLSKVRYPNSKHNSSPSLAIDIAPYPIDWNNVNRFYLLAGYVLATAKQMGINLRWGGDWDGDYDITNNQFNDLGHFEVIL